MHKLTIPTKKREQIIDITLHIQRYLTEKGGVSGMLTVFSPHTTAAITVNENADPNVKKDINNFLKKMIPQDYGFFHMEGNADAHIKGSLMNFSYTFIVEDGKLQLGTWQGVYFMEFDGPRSREVWLKFVPD